MVVKSVRKFNAKSQSLREVYQWTNSWCHAVQLRKPVMRAFLMAVYEAACNKVEHAYENMEASAGFAITLVSSGKAAIALVEDQGRFFDIDSVARLDFSKKIQDREIGELGVHFIRCLMDRVLTRKKNNNINQLVMIKYLSPSFKPTHR
jgi:serine/threonine-protein kinase RsbW